MKDESSRSEGFRHQTYTIHDIFPSQLNVPPNLDPLGLRSDITVYRETCLEFFWDLNKDQDTHLLRIITSGEWISHLHMNSDGSPTSFGTSDRRVSYPVSPTETLRTSPIQTCLGVTRKSMDRSKPRPHRSTSWRLLCRDPRTWDRDGLSG